MKIINVEQGSKEWLDARRAKVTGTDLSEVMGTPIARLNLIAELIAEEGTEQIKSIRPTPEMERGIAEETFAIIEYEKRYGTKTEKAGLCVSDEFEWFGFSPDRLEKDNFGKYSVNIEVKSPDSKTVVLYRMSSLGAGLSKAKQSFCGVPQEYKWQIIASFIVNTDQKKAKFIVHDPRFIDSEMKLLVIEVDRENPLVQEAIEQAREELVKFRQEWLFYKDLVLPVIF